jgi:hypothetical protein
MQLITRHFTRPFAILGQLPYLEIMPARLRKGPADDLHPPRWFSGWISSLIGN